MADYTLNPMNEQNYGHNHHQILSRPVRSYGEPVNYSNIKFTYSNKQPSSVYNSSEKPNSRIRKPLFDPHYHYFPITDSISAITRKPILDSNMHQTMPSNLGSEYKVKVEAYEPDT
jgi:hypothetical protein